MRLALASGIMVTIGMFARIRQAFYHNLMPSLSILLLLTTCILLVLMERLALSRAR